MSRRKTAPVVPDQETIDELNAIERRIQDGVAEARRLRSEQRRLFNPGYLYVVEFDSGVVKVGYAANAEARLKAHAKTGLVRRSWVSALHLWMNKTERELIARCAERGSLYGGREYFRGIDFTWACEAAEEIVTAALRQAVADGVIPHEDLAELRRQVRAEVWAERDLEQCREMHASFGRTVEHITESVDVMLRGAGGDLEANALEAYRRATGE